jgi:hypothetical protein
MLLLVKKNNNIRNGSIKDEKKKKSLYVYVFFISITLDSFLFPLADGSSEDIIDEALDLFRANCLFRNFEIKGNGDRVLIYLILFISQCLGSINKNTPKGDASKTLNTLAVSSFSIPSDPSFPLNAMYQGPTDKFQSGKFASREMDQDVYMTLYQQNI